MPQQENTLANTPEPTFNNMSRTFESTPAVRTRVPLIMAIAGASGSGKTMSALRLAVGMQQVFGGTINVIDTEKRRSLHYADQFKFEHTPFEPPYSPGDYSEALAHVRNLKPGVVIIDQLSYELDGLGGVLEMHEAELDRMAGNDWGKREKCKMAAWIRPKQDRRRLINELVQIGSDFAIIMLFRAKETAKPVKDAGGKTQIEDQGFMPIAAGEFLFEATASCVLYPGSNGVPTWQTEFKGEKLYMKLPAQFKDILAPGKQLSEDMGKRLAEWAKGGTAGTMQTQQKPERLAGAPNPNQALLDAILKALGSAAKDFTGDEKKAKMAELSTKYFKVAVWADVGKLPVADLENGLLTLKATEGLL